MMQEVGDVYCFGRSRRKRRHEIVGMPTAASIVRGRAGRYTSRADLDAIHAAHTLSWRWALVVLLCMYSPVSGTPIGSGLLLEHIHRLNIAAG